MRKFLDKNKYGLIFTTIVFLIVMPIYISAKIKFANIEKEGKLGIGKFVEYKRFPNTRDYYFEYYKNGIKVRDLVKNLPLNFHTEIGNFFEIKYLDETDDIVVNQNKKITDTVAIINAGFSYKDLISY